MAINSTNTIPTQAGVDSNSCYIRLEIKLLPNGKAAVKFFIHPDKAHYAAGQAPVNDTYDFDFSRFLSDVLLPADANIDNVHDLAIAELVNRGLDNAKLSKVDLV